MKELKLVLRTIFLTGIGCSLSQTIFFGWDAERKIISFIISWLLSTIIVVLISRKSNKEEYKQKDKNNW